MLPSQVVDEVSELMRCLNAVNISLRGKFSRNAIFLLPLSRNSTTGISVKFEVEADQENTRSLDSILWSQPDRQLSETR